MRTNGKTDTNTRTEQISTQKTKQEGHNRQADTQTDRPRERCSDRDEYRQCLSANSQFGWTASNGQILRRQRIQILHLAPVTAQVHICAFTMMFLQKALNKCSSTLVFTTARLHKQIDTLTHTHTITHTLTYIHVHAFMHTYTDTHVHACMHASTNARTHTHTYIHTYTHIHTHVRVAGPKISEAAAAWAVELINFAYLFQSFSVKNLLLRYAIFCQFGLKFEIILYEQAFNNKRLQNQAG